MAFNATTGLGTAAQIVISGLLPLGVSVPNYLELSLSALSPDTSVYQISAQVEDLSGTVQTLEYPFTYFSQNPSIVIVNSSGLITAVSTGQTIVEVSYPAFQNALGYVPGGNPNYFGWPDEKIYFEISVHVVN